MSGISLKKAALIGLGLGLMTSACRTNYEEDCTAGTLSCPCLPDQTCGSNLVCQSDVCIDPMGGTSDDTSESSSEADTESGSETDTMNGDGDGDTGDGDGDTGDGDGDTGDGDGDTGDGDGDTGDGDGDGDMGLECADAVLDPAYGVDLVEIETLPLSDDFEGSCNTGAGGKDAAYEWIVPFDGWFEVHTRGSDFDTLVYMLEDACDGPEVACSNNGLNSGDDGSIIEQFSEGDRYLIVVDGNVGASGTAKLSVEVIDCPEQDLAGGETLPQEFTHLGGDNDHGGSCGGDGNPERSYRFTAPDAGLWRFSALSLNGTGIESAVYLENGPACGAPEIACNGGGASGFGSPAAVSRYLEAGQETTVIIDSLGTAGVFTLDAEMLDTQCPLDAGADPTQAEINIDNIDDYPDTFTASCGNNADLEFGQHTPYPDYVFAFDDLPPGSPATCYLEVNANFPYTISAMEGECTGREVHCSTHDAGAAGGFNFPETGGRITVVITPNLPSWQGWIGSDFTVSSFCAI